MEHFVVISDWANDYECGVGVLGVTHSLEEARVIFNNSILSERDYAEEHGYYIFSDSDTDFDSGEEGYYIRRHTRLYIQKV